MMKKIQFYAPGDIRVEEAEIPVPEAGEIVIKNEVTLTCGTDVKTYKRDTAMNRRSAWGMKQAVSYMPSVKGLPGLKSVIVWLHTILHPAEPVTIVKRDRSPCVWI